VCKEDVSDSPDFDFGFGKTDTECGTCRAPVTVTVHVRTVSTVKKRKQA
jgi:hypothetical protein